MNTTFSSIISVDVLRPSGLSLSTILALCILFLSACHHEDKIAPAPLVVGSFTQMLPGATSEVQTLTPQFTWTAAENAVSYTLTVSTHADFSKPAVVASELTVLNYTPTEPLLPFEKYYWKVSAANAKDTTDSDNAGISFATTATVTNKYYVALTGLDSEGRGSDDLPFKTVAYAASAVAPGTTATIYIGAGIFTETEPIVLPVGINIVGAGEGQTTIFSSGVTLPEGIDPGAADYVNQFQGTLIQMISPAVGAVNIAPTEGNQILTGFTIDGNNKSLKAGVWVQNRNNVTMSHINFKELDQRGAVFTAGSKNLSSGSDQWMRFTRIYNCTFTNSGKDLTNQTLGNLCISGLDGADIHDLIITDDQGYGIKFINGGFFQNCKLHDLSITLNEYDAKWGEDIAIELWSVGPGNEIYNVTCNTWFSFVNVKVFMGSQNVKVHDIKMIDLDGRSSLQSMELGANGIEVYDSYFQNKGFGMAVWDGGNANITIRNNVFFNTRIQTNWANAGAVYINNSTTSAFSNINIYNNVFDTYQSAVQLVRLKSSIGNVNIKNNAFLNVNYNDVLLNGTNISNVSIANNIKYNAVPKDWNVNGSGAVQTDNLTGDPGFINSGDRWDTFYKPASASSKVVDKGVDVGLPFKGAAPDIGWWEF